MLFDPLAALEVTAGSRDLLVEILAMFVSQVEVDLHNLCMAEKAGDISAVRDLSHRIKGTCGGVAADHLRTLAAEVETLAKMGTLQGVADKLVAMQDCYARTIVEMSNWRADSAPT